MARDEGTVQVGTGTAPRPPRDAGELLNLWLAGLDASEAREAHACLMSGRYSRRLLASLRTTFPAGTHVWHGLDDPYCAQVGDPLSATVQTVLRERLLAPDLVEASAGARVPEPPLRGW